MKGRRNGVALAAGILGLALPASASAEAQVGATFAPSSDCSDQPATAFQSTSPDGQYAAPFTGVISSWSFQGGPVAPQQLKLKVARAAGTDSFTIVGESATESPAASAPNTFPTRISVQAGDVIGFFISGVDPECGRLDTPGYSIHFLLGDPPPGITSTYMPLPDRQIDVSAILEPDCDRDGFGDETQDPTPACPRTLTLDASKNKVKKGKKVRLTGQLNEVVRQGACESGQTVQLQRKRPGKPTFKTVQQLQTDAGGNFSARKKVKKTFQYRAQVAETATCANGTSNTEKVKVKKRK